MERLEAAHYVASAELATALHLALVLGRPILLEGEAGVGKTELAKVLAELQQTRLIRLQCYEGLDAAAALYEWNYLKQILHIRLAEGLGREALAASGRELFSEEFLLRRPLLEAISAPDVAPVLLIDEIDRADEEFEAFLLELLADYQVTVPELGTIRARHRPHVVLTSNRTRDLSDALRRRCLYVWLDYPDAEREERILSVRAPGLSAGLARQIAGVMQVLRRQQLNKPPGIAESLDWAVALMALHRDELDLDVVRTTLSCFVKDPDDLRQLAGPFLEALLGRLPGPGAGRSEWEKLAAALTPS